MASWWFVINSGAVPSWMGCGTVLNTVGLLLQMARRDQFDHVVIETTGLADPKPIIETFVAYPVRWSQEPLVTCSTREGCTASAGTAVPMPCCG